MPWRFLSCPKCWHFDLLKGGGDAWYALVENHRHASHTFKVVLPALLLGLELEVRAESHSVSDKDTVLRATVRFGAYRKKGGIERRR